MKIFDTFVRFLHEEDAYSIFITNSGFTDLQVSDLCRNPAYYIFESFNWKICPEGYEFWKIIDEKWDDIVHKEIHK